MNWSNWKKRFRFDDHTPTGRFVAPTFALDLEPGFVAAARLNPSKRRVQTVGVRELPAGVLEPSANKTNIADSSVVRTAITELCDGLGRVGGRLGLLIPDVAVRVALLQFESLPESPREAESLVLWRMREYLPYAPEEAHLSYQVLLKQPDSVEIIAIAARGSVLAEYQATLEGINAGPAVTLPATIALLPLLPDEGGGQLLLHLCPGALTTVVVASNRVRYWRTRALEADPWVNLGEVAREASRVVATCQDNLAVQIENVWVCARPPAEREVEEALANALGREYLPVAAVAASAALPAAQREAFQQYGMPFAGLMANSN
jgi:hypothetical protein